jgi:hypothetical protein
MRHLIDQASGNEGICELRDIPVANCGLVPVAVAAAAEVCGVGREVRVKTLQKPIWSSRQSFVRYKQPLLSNFAATATYMPRAMIRSGWKTCQPGARFCRCSGMVSMRDDRRMAEGHLAS